MRIWSKGTAPQGGNSPSWKECVGGRKEGCIECVTSLKESPGEPGTQLIRACLDPPYSPFICQPSLLGAWFQQLKGIPNLATCSQYRKLRSLLSTPRGATRLHPRAQGDARTCFPVPRRVCVCASVCACACVCACVRWQGDMRWWAYSARVRTRRKDRNVFLPGWGWDRLYRTCDSNTSTNKRSPSLGVFQQLLQKFLNQPGVLPGAHKPAWCPQTCVLPCRL